MHSRTIRIYSMLILLPLLWIIVLDNPILAADETTDDPSVMHLRENLIDRFKEYEKYHKKKERENIEEDSKSDCENNLLKNRANGTQLRYLLYYGKTNRKYFYRDNH